VSATTGPVLVAGGISFVNQALINTQPVNWKIPLAAGFTAVALAGLEKVWPEGALAMAYMLVVGVLFIPISGKPSPMENMVSFLQKNGFTS
jgi:hypothetical protein